MMKIGKRMSLVSRSLRVQVIVAFCLMSIIPILVLLNFIFPSLFPKTYHLVASLAVVGMVVFGFVLVKRIVDPIILIASEAKVIAKGEISHTLDFARDDEIGELSNSLNQLTQRIKDHMDDLKVYGERTKDINIQINQQVNALSGLLQISNFVAKGTALKDIFDITISRLTQVGESSLAFLIFEKGDLFEIKAHFGIEEVTVAALGSSAQHFVLKNVLSLKRSLRVDKTSRREGSQDLLNFFNVQNLLVEPVIVQRRPVGLLGFGNKVDLFEYTEEDVELLNIFAKQLAIAIENDLLVRKVEDLEIKDGLTDLYNRRYIIMRLEEEILRSISHQRPCAFVCVKVGNLRDLQSRVGEDYAEEVLKKTANLLKSSVTDVHLDKVGRIEDSIFGMILPEKNKRQAQDLAAEMKEKIGQAFAAEESVRQPKTVVCVVENPVDGPDAATLIAKAKELLS
ncbi:MAG: diguanylate cyclase [Candidatus Omnitrophota bacterium]